MNNFGFEFFWTAAMLVLVLPMCLYLMWRIGRADGMKEVHALIQPRVAPQTTSLPMPPTGGPYREAGVSGSAPSAADGTKNSKPRPFVPGQTVLVRLHKDGSKNAMDSPWFTAIFVGISRTSNYNFVRLKVGDLTSEPYHMDTTTLLHPDGSPSTELNESEQHNESRT